MQKSGYVIGAALAIVLFATSPAAAQTTTFDLTGAGSNTVLAGVYTSPYTATVGGIANVPVICDDFSDESYVPEDWTAYVASLSSISSGTTHAMWTGATVTVDGPTTTLTQAQAYDVAAILSIGILGQGNTGSVTQQDLSYALWGLFAPGPAFSQLNGLSNQSAAEADLRAAVTDVTGNMVGTQTLSSYLSGYDVTIYSYDPSNGVWNCGGCSGPPQEFITATAMAEPPAPALLGVDLLGLVGLVLVARRCGRLAR
jgi:hypothetical protein